MKQDFYKPEVKQWKEENPQLWKALQLLWLGLVIGNVLESVKGQRYAKLSLARV